MSVILLQDIYYDDLLHYDECHFAKCNSAVRHSDVRHSAQCIGTMLTPEANSIQYFTLVVSFA
jgi:hypothetical protein